MSSEYAVYREEYEQSLSKVRSFLSSNARSLTTLRECERLLAEARRNANSMEELAKNSGDSFQINEAKRRVEQEIMPLLEEVDRTIAEREQGGFQQQQQQQQQQRTELFSGYRAPSLGQNDDEGDDMEMLIRNSEDMLRHAQNMCNDSEQLGSETLNLMGRQREQLQNASSHLTGAQAYFTEAGDILQDM